MHFRSILKDEAKAVQEKQREVDDVVAKVVKVGLKD